MTQNLSQLKAANITEEEEKELRDFEIKFNSKRQDNKVYILALAKKEDKA